MSSLRPPREYSPPRHYGHNRSSTGNMYVTSYDTLSSTQPGRSSVSAVSNQPSSVIYEAHPVRKDGKKTEYVVKPRRNSSTVQDNKRPLAISTRNVSPSRRGILVASPREIVSAHPARDDSSRQLQPASTLSPRSAHHSHQRHSSASRTELGRHDHARDDRDRLQQLRGSRGHTAPKQYYSARSQPPRPSEEGEWEYTGPREQFDRDYPVRPRRDSHNRRERMTTYDTDRSSGLRREYAPPPSSPARYPERDDRDGSTTHSHHHSSGIDSDPDRPSEHARRRQSARAPVLHQNPTRDDGYSSAREDNGSRNYHKSRKYRDEDENTRQNRYHDSKREPEKDRRRDRERERERERDEDRDRRKDYDRSEREHQRKPRSRDNSPDRSRLKEFAVGALGSLATAGGLSMLGRDGKDKDKDKDQERDKDSETDGDGKKEHRRRHRRHRKDTDLSDDSDSRSPKHTNGAQKPRRQASPDSETREDASQYRQNPRRKDESDDKDARSIPSQRPPRPRNVSRIRSRDTSPFDTSREAQALVPVQPHDDQYDSLTNRAMSPGENEDDRPRRVTLVEPEKKEEVKPRGILKPTRQVPFPEDPNPVREGVAPLKDAHKSGIPPNSRWTKINRVLVNPEALERYNERYEERDDYVIVLRVLTKDEIRKLADKTQEIREIRERDWQRRIEDRRRDVPDDGSSDRSDHDDEEHKPPLMLEPAPAGPPPNFYGLNNMPSAVPPVVPYDNQHLYQPPHQNLAPATPYQPGMPGVYSVPDLNQRPPNPDSYSQNV